MAICGQRLLLLLKIYCPNKYILLSRMLDRRIESVSERRLDFSLHFLFCLNKCLTRHSDCQYDLCRPPRSSQMISLLIFSLLASPHLVRSAPLSSSGELLSKELNSVEEIEAKNQEDGSDWVARIVPGFSLSDLFQPIQLQIPVLTLPDLPSYTIALS